MYIVHCMYTVSCMQNTVFCTLYTVYRIHCKTQLQPFILSYFVLVILSMTCGLWTVYWKLYTVHFRLYYVYVLCTGYCLHKKPLNKPWNYNDVPIFGKLWHIANTAIMANFLNNLYMNYSNFLPILSTLIFV